MKQFSGLFLMLISSGVFAQWEGTNPVYFTSGNVGIGTTTPSSKLHIQTNNALQGISLNHNQMNWISYFSPSMSSGAYNGITLNGDAGVIYGGPSGPDNFTHGFVLAPHASGISGLRMDKLGNVGVGISAPLSKLHVKDGAIMSSDKDFNSINLRMDGRLLPAIRFTRWTGSGNVQHNAFIGQFINASAGNEYSLGIGTGTSGTGDQDVHTNVISILTNGNVGIGTQNPLSAFQINGEGQRTSFGNVPQTYRQQLGWVTQYMGFNLSREAQGWSTYSDGANNGGSMILADPFGQIKFVNVASSGNGTRYLTEQQINDNTKFIVAPSGNVGIGTTTMDAKLTVKGTVHASEIKVDLNVPGPDYVFDPTYVLPSLDSVQLYINQNKHLPEVPSAREMEANGVNLGEMNMLLLKKVEELMLYAIEANKKIEEQDKQIQKILKTVKVK